MYKKNTPKKGSRNHKKNLLDRISLKKHSNQKPELQIIFKSKG